MRVQGSETAAERRSAEKQRIPSARVLRYWRLAPIGTMLRVERLRWAQDTVRHPEAHLWRRTALFGALSFEPIPPLTAEGTLDPRAATAWAQQFVENFFHRSLRSLALFGRSASRWGGQLLPLAFVPQLCFFPMVLVASRHFFPIMKLLFFALGFS